MMTHHHLAFESTDCFKSNTYYDEYCRTTEWKTCDACEVLEYNREYCDDTKEYCTYQSNL